MIPLEPTLAMLQCLAFPKSLENMKTVINAQNALAGTANITINSPGVPCLRLPIGGRAGKTVALGVIRRAAVATQINKKNSSITN